MSDSKTRKTYHILPHCTVVAASKRLRESKCQLFRDPFYYNADSLWLLITVPIDTIAKTYNTEEDRKQPQLAEANKDLEAKYNHIATGFIRVLLYYYCPYKQNFHLVPT